MAQIWQLQCTPEAFMCTFPSQSARSPPAPPSRAWLGRHIAEPALRGPQAAAGGRVPPRDPGRTKAAGILFFLLFVRSVHHSEKSVFVLPPKYWPHFNIRAEFHDHQGGVFIWSCCFSVISLDSFFMLLVCFSLIFWIFLNPKFICFDFESVEKYARPHFLKLW